MSDYVHSLHDLVDDYFFYYSYPSQAICETAEANHLMTVISFDIIIFDIRSIDFAKASGNIALVPHMETVNLQDTLSTAVNIIRYVPWSFVQL